LFEQWKVRGTKGLHLSARHGGASLAASGDQHDVQDPDSCDGEHLADTAFRQPTRAKRSGHELTRALCQIASRQLGAAPRVNAFHRAALRPTSREKKGAEAPGIYRRPLSAKDVICDPATMK
jgi:hypothetical protein